MYEPKSARAHEIPLSLALSKADSQRLMQFIARRVRNPADRADLMQEVLTRALRRPAEMIRDPLNYLRAIARNVICDFFKSRGARSAVVFDSTLAEETAEQSLDAVANALSDQDALAARMDAERMIRQALSRLPPTHRNVLLATMGGKLTYEEAAQKLELSVHTIKKYAHEAKAQIRMMVANSGVASGGEGL